MSAQPAYSYNAWLVDHSLAAIVDGDTLHCGVDLGLDVAINITIRLYGLNAPEMSTAAGKLAKEFVLDWFSRHAVDGKFVLQTVKDHREKYGRYLGMVVASDGANLNDDLIAAGQAIVYFPKAERP
jgi:micrococcal nuclease